MVSRNPACSNIVQLSGLRGQIEFYLSTPLLPYHVSYDPEYNIFRIIPGLYISLLAPLPRTWCVVRLIVR